MTNARHLSLSSDHYTPREVVEAARATMGGIDLDPASCALANRELVKASTWFGPGSNVENGFTTTWEGRVFLNPPGGKCDASGVPVTKETKTIEGTSRSSQKAWWFKLATEWLEGCVEQAVFVGFSLEILQVTQSNTPCAKDGLTYLPIPLDFPCCYPSRRIAYLKESIALGTREEDGRTSPLVVGGSPPHASVLVWLPRRDALSASAKSIERAFLPFATLGKCVTPYAMNYL